MTMPLVFGLMIALVLTIFVLSTRKRGSVVAVENIIHEGDSIPVTRKMLEAELEDNGEVIMLLEANIRASGLFRIEKIPELVSMLRAESRPFARVNATVAFGGDEILSLEEKRALGLNSRMKYSKAFIGYFEPTILKTIEPKSVLEDMHLSAFHCVARKRELIKIRELGFVKKVKIVPVGDARDCNKIKRFKKIYDLHQVPDLPLTGCTAPYCRCVYEPIISDSL